MKHNTSPGFTAVGIAFAVVAACTLIYASLAPATGSAVPSPRPAPHAQESAR